MKKYILTGAITLLPLALTIMIINWLLNLLTSPFVGIVEWVLLSYEEALGLSLKHHDVLVLFISRIIVIIFLFVFLFILGFISHKFFVKPLMKGTGGILNKIPFVRGIYRMSKEVTKSFFTQGEKAFKKTVLVPFPNENTKALAFLTGDVPPSIKKYLSDVDYSIFVPTAPHPLSGFVLLSSEKQIKETDISIEDAFKFLLSCGAVHPGERPSQEKTHEP